MQIERQLIRSASRSVVEEACRRLGVDGWRIEEIQELSISYHRPAEAREWEEVE